MIFGLLFSLFHHHPYCVWVGALCSWAQHLANLQLLQTCKMFCLGSICVELYIFISITWFVWINNHLSLLCCQSSLVFPMDKMIFILIFILFLYMFKEFLGTESKIEQSLKYSVAASIILAQTYCIFLSSSLKKSCCFFGVRTKINICPYYLRGNFELLCAMFIFYSHSAHLVAIILEVTVRSFPGFICFSRTHKHHVPRIVVFLLEFFLMSGQNSRLQ